MTIRYHNTFRDVMAFCFYHYPRSPMVIASYGVGFLLISFVLFQSLPKDGAFLPKLLAFLVLEVVAPGFCVAVSTGTLILGMVSRRNKTILTEHTIVLGQERFTSETPYSRTEWKWSVVQKLVRTRSYIYIYISQHSAHVLPRRAFPTVGDWDSFYELCRQRTRKA